MTAPEPSNAEQALWSDATRDYVESLRQEIAENDGVIAVWRRRCQTAENKKVDESIELIEKRIKRLEADLEDARERKHGNDQIDALVRISEDRTILGIIGMIKNSP